MFQEKLNKVNLCHLVDKGKLKLFKLKVLQLQQDILLVVMVQLEVMVQLVMAQLVMVKVIKQAVNNNQAIHKLMAHKLDTLLMLVIKEAIKEHMADKIDHMGIHLIIPHITHHILINILD